ncbi:TPA: hypothetical protein BOS_25566 [Bos taurus]|nr:TPA: hypothetical protein BOS_25566 [Bos taurus]
MLVLRLTAEDPGLLQNSIVFCLEELSLVMQSLQHFGGRVVGTEEGFKPSLCALASGVVPQGVAFCSTLIGLHLMSVLLFGAQCLHSCLVIVNCRK